MFKTVLTVAAVSFGVGLVLTPGTAQAACNNNYAGPNFGKIWDSTTCSGAGYVLNTGQKPDLHVIGWNDKIGSVQTPADTVRVDGYEDTGYNGWKWTLLGYAAHGSWLSFGSDPTVNNETSSIFLSVY